MTFENVTKFMVPAHIVDKTDAQLRGAGRNGCECFVLWTGSRENGNFYINTVHVPRQTAYRYEEGVCVRVDGPELHRLNLWLFENQEELAIQIHSHPTDAFHSETDDACPIVTTLGGLSIVVPDFAKNGLRRSGVAYYRLGLSGWIELSPFEARRLVVMER